MKQSTRRELVATLGFAAAAATAAPAQNLPQSTGNRDWYREALEGKKAAGKELAAFALPAGTEPSFQFKA